MLAAGAAAWLGAATGRAGGFLAWSAAAVIVAVGLASRRRPAMAAVALLVVGLAAGWASARREAGTLAAELPSGGVRLAGVVTADPRLGDGYRFSVRPSHIADGSTWVDWAGPRLEVRSTTRPQVEAGEGVLISGELRRRPHRYRGDPVAGTLAADTIEKTGGGHLPFRLGNWLRQRILNEVGQGPEAAEALLAGFLIGDTSGLTAADVEALRRAGLSHFVAVSGSNVALFLAAWWLAAGPLAWGPRRRAVLGLLGLGIFVIATRWEPSVVRAATMAAMVLAGRLAALPVDAWTALGAAIAVLVVVSPEIVGDVGFQLSVAATAGVLVGAPALRHRRPRWAWAALTATASAQAAVTPLLLVHFGSVPLLSPLANLVAAPLVAAATIVGGIGAVAGQSILVGIGVAVAGLVLAVARTAADWPQLGPAGVALTGCATLLAVRFRSLRGPAAVTLGFLVLVSSIPRAPPGVPTAVFLDVGQGDAILLLGPEREAILVDGGPNGPALLAALRRHGVRRVGLMVATHRHADHLTGLEAAAAAIPVDRLWYPDQEDPEGALAGLAQAARSGGAITESVAAGQQAQLGAFHIEVLGPARRYASPNDGSVVLRVTTSETSLLLSGDIEAVAQRELGPLPANILKVPHQGAATSDLDWLAASAGVVSVISVGPNDFGHPADEVIEVLLGAGSVVLRTDRIGDVVIPMP